MTEIEQEMLDYIEYLYGVCESGGGIDPDYIWEAYQYFKKELNK